MKAKQEEMMNEAAGISARKRSGMVARGHTTGNSACGRERVPVPDLVLSAVVLNSYR